MVALNQLVTQGAPPCMERTFMNSWNIGTHSWTYIHGYRKPSWNPAKRMWITPQQTCFFQNNDQPMIKSSRARTICSSLDIGSIFSLSLTHFPLGWRNYRDFSAIAVDDLGNNPTFYQVGHSNFKFQCCPFWRQITPESSHNNHQESMKTTKRLLRLLWFLLAKSFSYCDYPPVN